MSKPDNGQGLTPKTLDPLYVIFEQHLHRYQDSDQDRKTFIDQVVQDYLTYLRRLKISIPKPLEVHLIEELAVQINIMLVKKTYGFLNIKDYQQTVPQSVRRKVRDRYSRLKLSAKTK